MSDQFSIHHYMTPNPITIDIQENLKIAISLMHHNGIKHLAVLEDGKPVNIISEEDIRLVQSFDHESLDNILVEEICSPLTFITKYNDSLSDVTRKLAADKLTGTIITKNDELVGIFTMVDAFYALAELVDNVDHKESA